MKNIWGRRVSISIVLLFSFSCLYAIDQQECARINSSPELLQVYNTAIKNGNVSSIMWALRDDLKQPKAERVLAEEKLNLCDIKVAGSRTLFCQTNKGITRINMPQLSGKPIAGTPADILLQGQNLTDKKAKKVLLEQLKTNNSILKKIVEDNFNKESTDGSKIKLSVTKGEVDATEYFKEYLVKKGKTITRTTVPAAQLQATQNELIPDKINQMWWALELGPCNQYYAGITAPIFVSQDNYVLDGHHRWAAIVSNAFGRVDMNTVMMDVLQINEVIGDERSGLVKLANEFANDFGISVKAGS